MATIMSVAQKKGTVEDMSNTDRRKTCIRFILVSVSFLLFGPSVVAGQDVTGQEIVKTKCVSCHRIEGDPMPRRTKKAPDLIWAGSKYQREWLGKWLQNPNEKLYPLGFDFNMRRKGRHLVLASSQAQAVVDFLQTLKDPRVKEGVMKSGTSQELERGKELYKEHACQNCHWTPAKNRRGYTGGTSSTSLVNMGNRLQADWVYRFNQNPNDFVPESGAYIPNPPIPDEDIYAITAYMMTFK
jgi:mono/diheme cytochrome c family protein